MDIVQELGAFGLCAAMLTLLGWIIKKQANTISNHLVSIEKGIASLPCRNRPDCPEDEP